MILQDSLNSLTPGGGDEGIKVEFEVKMFRAEVKKRIKEETWCCN